MAEHISNLLALDEKAAFGSSRLRAGAVLTELPARSAPSPYRLTRESNLRLRRPTDRRANRLADWPSDWPHEFDYSAFGHFSWNGLVLEIGDLGEAGGAGSMLDISLVGVLFLLCPLFFLRVFYTVKSFKEAPGDYGLFLIFCQASVRGEVLE